MKAKKETNNISNNEIKPNLLEKEKAKEEHKTSPTFTFKDFQKSIKEKSSKTSTVSFPEELPKEVKLPIPIQNNINSSLVVEKKDNEKLNEKLANEELEKEKKKEKEKEKKTKDDYEEETEIESESNSDIKFESDDDDDEYEYKIVRIKLIPFIFTEKYEQVKGFIKNSRITCYSLLNVINNGIVSDIEFKEIEDRIKDKLSEILIVDYENIKLKLNKNDDSRFYFDCYVRIYGDSFNESFYDNDDQIIKYTIRKYQKHYKDTYKKEYDAEKHFFDYFKYLKDYLNIYLKIIYGSYNWHIENEISKIIEKDFTINRVNPFTYNENIIPFREIRTKFKDVIKTTIMKMGFIFDYVSEIKKDKD